MNLFTKQNRLTDIGNKLMVTKGDSGRLEERFKKKKKSLKKKKIMVILIGEIMNSNYFVKEKILVF